MRDYYQFERRARVQQLQKLSMADRDFVIAMSSMGGIFALMVVVLMFWAA